MASDKALLDELEWDGCMTGDCPHSLQRKCDQHLADQLRDAVKRRDKYVIKPNLEELAEKLMSLRRVRLITEAEDIYVMISDDEPPEVIVYGRSAFVWSNVALAYMEQHTVFVEEQK